MSKFKFIMAGDPQYPWTLNDDKAHNMGSSGNWHGMNPTAESYGDDADKLAEMQVKSINALINQESASGSPIKGVMFNGDLVNYNSWTGASSTTDLARFKENYEGIAIPIYCGLGNHDYEMNVDDTFENRGATSMVEYLIDNCAKNEIANCDYRKMEDYTFPSLRTVYTGSFAYSFDIENVHFVQLNNYPGYTKSWGNFRSDRAREVDVNVTDCFDWLENDLRTARAAGKAIIVAHHQRGDSYERYVDLFNKYKVSAVFVGHSHTSYGRASISNSSIPLFYCGSTSQSNYILMECDDDKVTVRGISSIDGEHGFIENAVETFELITVAEDNEAGNPAGYVNLFSEGGYTVEFTLKYTVSGRQYTFETGKMKLGNKKTYDLPAGASAYEISCRAWNGSKWKSPFYTEDSDTPFNCTFRTYGALPNPKMEIIYD